MIKLLSFKWYFESFMIFGTKIPFLLGCVWGGSFILVHSTLESRTLFLSQWLPVFLTEVYREFSADSPGEDSAQV